MVPLVRLSIALMTMTRPVSDAVSSYATWICAAFDPYTAAVCGHWPSGSRLTNGSSPYAFSYAARTWSEVTPGFALALHVARMPRGIGASVGVKETETRSPAAALKFWIISGCAGDRRPPRTATCSP